MPAILSGKVLFELIWEKAVESLSPGEGVTLQNPNNREVHEWTGQIRVPRLFRVKLGCILWCTVITLTSVISYQYRFFSKSCSFFAPSTFLKCRFTCIVAVLFSNERAPLTAWLNYVHSMIRCRMRWSDRFQHTEENHSPSNTVTARERTSASLKSPDSIVTLMPNL